MADQNVEQNPGQQGAGADSGQAQAGAAGAPADKGVAQGQGQGQSQQQQQERVFTFKEDRSDWIPRTRLNEVSGKLTKLEQENLTYKQQLELAEKRTKAALGIETPTDDEKQAAEVKAALLKLVPGLKAIEGLTPEQIQEVFEAAQTARSTTQAQWERHAENMFSSVEEAVADELGLDKLTDTQIRRIRREYREAAAEALQSRPRDENGRPVDPTGKDFLSRHEKGDKTLVADFVKGFLADWYEPARRSVTRGAVSRQSRPVPRGERTRNTPVQGPPQIDYNNQEQFEKALLEARNSRG